MTDRLLQLRNEQVDLLKRELEAAILRIQYYRKRYPAINECEFGYFLDASSNEGLEDSGGFVRPNYRMWPLGRVFAGSTYIYEDIDYSRWRAQGDSDKIGTDTYGLALSDPAHATYHNSTPWIGKVSVEKLVDNSSFALDAIITITDALKQHFETEEAFREIVKEFTDSFVHRAASKFVLN